MNQETTRCFLYLVTIMNSLTNLLYNLYPQVILMIMTMIMEITMIMITMITMTTMIIMMITTMIMTMMSIIEKTMNVKKIYVFIHKYMEQQVKKVK